MLVFKSKQFRFADIAYVGANQESLAIDLYVVGKAFKKITIDGMICIEGEGCMRKSSFNEEYLSGAYPDDLLKNVFLAKPIFGGKNLEKTSSGFKQKIRGNGVDIIYKIDGQRVYFKDRMNKILIKIKDT
ncbi:MAG: hypothetical protein ABXS93_04800 [Sulfurimonas sp.]